MYLSSGKEVVWPEEGQPLRQYQLVFYPDAKLPEPLAEAFEKTVSNFRTYLESQK